MPRRYSYDPKCADLARHFLPEAPAGIVEELAQDIQDAIEAFDAEAARQARLDAAINAGIAADPWAGFSELDRD